MKLPDLEIEVLQHISTADTVTAPEVHKQIAAKREISYSAVKTIIDRLEKKDLVYRKAHVGRTAIYAAKMDQNSVQRSLLKEFIKKVFPQDKTPLFNTLIRDSSLTEQEIEYLKKLLEEKRGQ